MPPIHLIDDNIEVLSSSLAILGDLSDEDYKKTMAPYFAASIGKHIRHIVDHYFRLFDGLSAGLIDYDDRARDEHIETNVAYAQRTIKAINEQLRVLQQDISVDPELTQEPLSVKLCTSTRERRNSAMPILSSLERELVFVHGHTTHHYAIIAAILKMLEIPVTAEFGVAPSTLVYEKGLECAP